MLMRSNQDTRQDGVSFCSVPSAVATVGFSGDHRRSQHPFGLIVGGIQAVDVQKAQQVRPVLPQPFGKADIIGIGQSATRGDEPVQSVFQISSLLREGERIQSRLLHLELQRLAQQGTHLLGKLQRATLFDFLHLFQIGEQMN